MMVMARDSLLLVILVLNKTTSSGSELREIIEGCCEMNLSKIPENEQEGVLGTFWAMLKELESIAYSNEKDVILRHEVSAYYKQWNRITGDSKEPIWAKAAE